MRIYFRIVGMHVKSQLQHRASFITLTLGQALMTFSAVVSVLILMTKVKGTLEFTVMEMLLAGSIVNISFSIAECVFRGFDIFPQLLGNGQYERILLRPQNIMLQVLGSTMELSRLGRTAVSIVVFGIVVIRTPLTMPWVLVLMVVSGVILFGSLFIIYGACSFYTTESLEVFNILTDGGRQFGQIPYSLYGRNILKFLTFVIPLACFQYYPLLLVLGRSVPTYYALLPLASIPFLAISLFIWHVGQKHYQSTGS